MEITRDELSEAIAQAVSEGLRQGQHDQATAAGRHAGDDPLVQAAIESKVSDQVGKAVADIESRWQEKMDRALAEANMARADSGSGLLNGEWPLRKSLLIKERELATDELLAAQSISDDLYIIGKLARDPLAAARRYVSERGLEDSALAKALDTYTATGGAEWVPTVLSGQFITDIDARTMVAPLFPRLNMTAKNITLPGGAGVPVVYRATGGENATVSESAEPTTRSIALSAEDMKANRDYSDQLDEDSVVSAAAYIRSRLAYGIAYWLDRAILDGDTSATHMDTATVGSTDPRKMWIGLRKKARTDAGANQDLATFHADNLLSIPAAMGVYAENPADLVWIVPSKVYWGKLILLKDAQNNPVWLPVSTDSQAPIVTGQVGWIGGAPVVPSGLIRTDLNASGVYDGTTMTQTVLHLVNRQAWILGTRRDVTIETDKDIKKGTFEVVVTWRGDFAHLHGSGLTTALGYNL